MKYFVLLAGDGEMPGWDQLSPEEQEAGLAKHLAFDEACAAREGVEIVGGEALDATMATTLRTRGGEMTITDGPFAEAAEGVGGFYVLEAPDLDTVIELCRVLPAYDIDIRPVLDLELAAASYRVALARCGNAVERAHLERQLILVEQGTDPSS